MNFKHIESIIIPVLVFIIGVEISGGAIKIASIVLGEKLEEKVKPKENVKTQLKIANGYRPEDLSFLWENGLLGRDIPPPPSKEIQEIKPVISALSETYRLVGTIVGRTQRYAFLAPRSGGNIIVKKENEEIVPGAVISSIKDDMIEITRGNSKELIFLFEKDQEKFAAQQQSQEIPPTPAATLQNSTYQTFGTNESRNKPDLVQVGENTFEVKREYVQSSLSDMGALLTNARAIPYIKDGEIKGFRLLNITPGSFYKTIGIQDGDVIKSINGIPISNPQTIMKIFSDIQNETQFELKIERMGKEITMRYYIR